MLPGNIKQEDLQKARRTVIKLPDNHSDEYRDNWDPTEFRVQFQPPPDELWTGFTDLYFKRESNSSDDGSSVPVQEQEPTTQQPDDQFMPEQDQQQQEQQDITMSERPPSLRINKEEHKLLTTMRDELNSRDHDFTPREDGTDIWIHSNHLWIRQHFKVRQYAFMPDEASHGPNTKDLLPLRLTRGIAVPAFEDSGPPFHERWDNNIDFNYSDQFKYDLCFTWKGYTVFIEKVSSSREYKGRYDSITTRQEELEEQLNSEGPVVSAPSESARKAKGIASPGEP